MVFLGLTRKAGDHVSTQPQRRKALGNFQGSPAVLFACVPATHATQNRVGSALKRHMQVRYETPARSRHGLEQRIINFGGLDAAKPKAYIRDFVEKAHHQSTEGRPGRQVMPIVANVNARDDEFRMDAGKESGLGDDFIGFARPRNAAGQARGTERAFPIERSTEADLDERIPLRGLSDLNRVVALYDTSDSIHRGVLFRTQRGGAARDYHPEVWILAADAADKATGFRIRLIGDGAGVDHADFGLGPAFRRVSTSGFQFLTHPFGIVLVRLAAEGLKVDALHDSADQNPDMRRETAKRQYSSEIDPMSRLPRSREKSAPAKTSAPLVSRSIPSPAAK